jgi:hypothetical protein
MLKIVNKADVSQSQWYSYGEHVMLYLIFCWVWADLTIFPAYTESRPLIWALSHYSTPCQTFTILWQKFPLGNYIIGFHEDSSDVNFFVFSPHEKHFIHAHRDLTHECCIKMLPLSHSYLGYSSKSGPCFKNK